MTTSTVDTWQERPLRGDGKGIFRVHVIGNSGAGKSTLAKELGAILNVPVIHLDQLLWNPGWIESSTELFRSRLQALLTSEDYARGWVIDGNYVNRTKGMLDDETDVIWLDPPFLLYFPRLVWRTLLRIFRLGEPCAPGCQERASSAFASSDGILYWALSQHKVVRQREGKRLAEGVLNGETKMRRFGGWGGELKKWILDVREMVSSQ